MKLRREAKSLKAKAISSLKIGLEAFNGFSEDGRTTKTLLHLQHACEMLLKACLVQRQVNIQDPQKGHSVGFKKCLNLAREHCGFNETQAGVFRAVDSLRDGEQHWLIMVPEDVLFLHARAPSLAPKRVVGQPVHIVERGSRATFPLRIRKAPPFFARKWVACIFAYLPF
jgi:hypothetical protein